MIEIVYKCDRCRTSYTHVHVERPEHMPRKPHGWSWHGTAGTPNRELVCDSCVPPPVKVPNLAEEHDDEWSVEEQQRQEDEEADALATGWDPAI